MKLFGSSLLTVASYNDNIPKGSYKALVFHFSGTANAGNTVAVTDLGRLRIQRRGKDFCNVELQDLININNAECGHSNVVSALAGAFDIYVRYNFALPEDREAVAKFETGDNGLVQIVFAGTLAAKIATGNLEVYGVHAKGVEKYIVKTFDFSQNMPVTGGQISPKLEQANIQDVYFRTAADFGNIQILKDNYNLINSTGAALLDNTRYEYKIEAVAVAITFIFIELNKTRQLSEMISDNLQFQLVSAMAGGGATTILYRQLDFDANKTMSSLVSFKDFNSGKLAKAPAAKAVLDVLQSGSAKVYQPVKRVQATE